MKRWSSRNLFSEDELKEYIQDRNKVYFIYTLVHGGARIDTKNY